MDKIPKDFTSIKNTYLTCLNTNCSVYCLHKELPRVDRAQDPVEDQKSQLLCYSEILVGLSSILVKFYKSPHFTQFHSLFIYNFEETSYVLTLYLLENGKSFLNHCDPPLDTDISD